MTAINHQRMNQRTAMLMRLIASCFSLIAVLWLHVSGPPGMLHHPHDPLSSAEELACIHHLGAEDSCGTTAVERGQGLEEQESAQLGSGQLRCKQPSVIVGRVEWRRLEVPGTFYVFLPEWQLGQVAKRGQANDASSKVHGCGSSFGKDWISAMAETVVLRL